MSLDSYSITDSQLYFINMILAEIHNDDKMLSFVKSEGSGTSYALKVLDTLLNRKNPTELIQNKPIGAKLK